MDNIIETLVSDKCLESKGFYSTFESYYLQQGSKRIPKYAVEEEVDTLIRELSKYEGVKEAKLAGGNRRKNLFIENITIVVCCSNKTLAMKEACAKLSIQERDKTKITRIVNIDKWSVIEFILFVPEKEYAYTLLKYTGSKSFYAKIKNRAEQKGINLRKPLPYKTERELFDALCIPYLQPELRECADNITIPYESFILKENENIEGDIIPYSELGALSSLKDSGLSYIGVTISKEQFAKYGTDLIDTVKSLRIKDLKIYVGIKLDCISQYNENMEEFDFIQAKYYINKDNITHLYKIASSIHRPIILSDLGVTLETPLRIIETRLCWKSFLSFLATNNILLSINGDSIKNNLHPSLLNQFITKGGTVLPIGYSYTNNKDSVLLLMRKALIGLKSCIISKYRFDKLIGDNSNGIHKINK